MKTNRNYPYKSLFQSSKPNPQTFNNTMFLPIYRCLSEQIIFILIAGKRHFRQNRRKINFLHQFLFCGPQKFLYPISFPNSSKKKRRRRNFSAKLKDEFWGSDIIFYLKIFSLSLYNFTYIYLYAIVRYNSDKIFPYNVLNDMCYLLSFRQLISLSRPPTLISSSHTAKLLDTHISPYVDF